MIGVVQIQMKFARELLVAIVPEGVTAASWSLLLISVTGLVVLLLCYRVYASGEGSNRRTTSNKMKPEVLKEKTERWSEEASINPAFPPGESPERPTNTSSQYRPLPSEQPSNSPGDRDSPPSTPNTTNLDRGLSGMEFTWQTETGVSFDDIGGMDDLKDKLRAEVIKPLENPEKAEELGISAPNIVFHGPPGTGKTYTTEALATEMGLPFVSLSGADVQSKWINESSTKVNNLFTEAKQVAAKEGGAVVFLDELDSVLKGRSGSGSSHEEDNKVVNEFLNHLQETKENNIVFIGATNRLDALDDAGLRAGRIDLKIKVGKPDAAARESIIRAQLDGREHEITEEGIAELAAATNGAVAADLELLVNRAAKRVLARDGDVIRWTDIARLKP